MKTREREDLRELAAAVSTAIIPFGKHARKPGSIFGTEPFGFPAKTAVVQRYAVIARSGAGKTYAGGVLVEGLLQASAQVVVIDPVGTWWGLRLAADGKGSGLKIPIIGGLRGDVPLGAEHGALVAELVVNRRASMVIDVSMMREVDRKRFTADFLERLYELKKSQRSPLMLVLEEAATVAPQLVTPAEARMVGAVEDVVRRGRNFGIGVMLIDQRPQSVNKHVLNQTEVLILLQVNGPQERKTIEQWAASKATRGTVDFLEELPDLPIGTAWIWSPQWLRALIKVEIGHKTTFDASSTPELDDERYDPANTPELSAEDLEQLRGAMAAAVEKDETENPAKLRRRIAQLEKRVLELETQQPPPTPAISTELLEGLRMVEEAITTPAAGLKIAASRLTNIIALMEAAPAPALAPGGGRASVATVAQAGPPPGEAALHGPVKVEPVGELGGGQVRILMVLAQACEGAAGAKTGGKLSKRDLGVLACYQPEGGTFIRYLGELGATGLIDNKRGREEVWLTEQGRHWMIDNSKGRLGIRFTTDQVIAGHVSALGGGQGKILRTLAKCYPDSMDRKALGAMTSYEPDGGTFIRYVGELVGRGLIERVGDGELRARDALFTFGPWSGA